MNKTSIGDNSGKENAPSCKRLLISEDLMKFLPLACEEEKIGPSWNDYGLYINVVFDHLTACFASLKSMAVYSLKPKGRCGYGCSDEAIAQAVKDLEFL